MKIFKNLLRRSKSDTDNTYSEYYRSIDTMPLYHWIKCTRGDIRYVRIGVVPNSKETETDELIWAEIYAEYIDRFGLNKMYERLLKVIKRKAMLELDYVIKREKFKFTQIKMEEQRLKDMIANRGSGQTIEQSLVYLSQWLGHHIDPMRISVVEYFTRIEEYGKQNKAQ